MKTSIISLILLFLVSATYPQDSTWTDPDTAVVKPEPDLNEIISKRNYYSKTYYNEETNKYTTRISSNLMHYKDNKGRYRTIDKTITVSDNPEYSYKVTRGIYHAYFKSDITANFPVVFRLKNSKYFSMQPFALAYYDTLSKEHTVLGKVRSSMPEVRDNAIVYPGAFPGVHIKYVYNEKSLKEEVVLTDNFRNNRLPFPSEYGYQADNTILVLLTRIKYSDELDVYERYAKNEEKKLENSDLDDYTNTKSLHFINKKRLQFMLPVDIAYMAEDDSSESENPVIPLKRRLRRINDHLTVLTGIEYNQLMNLPEGNVILDPTVATVLDSVDDDTWLENTSVKGSYDKFIIGKCGTYPKKRSVIKFDISAIPSGATIDSSKMFVYWYQVYKPSSSSESIIARYVRANRVFTSWSESSATRDYPWNTAYGDFGATGIYDYSSDYEDEVYFDYYATGYCWKGFDLTTATTNWHSGSWTNNGVVLWATNEDTVGRTLRFRSSEYSDEEYRPFLEITYEHNYAKNYYLKDHLGNIRVTLDDAGDVIGYNDYYPFGLTMPERSMNNALSSDIYKYSGKELDEENGLDWYYFGARYYDPEIGRWLSVDPLAHKRPWLSPYVYCSNSPMNRIDPDGREDWSAVGWGAFQMYAGARLFIGGTTLMITSTAAETPSAGLTTFGVVGGLFLMSTGSFTFTKGLADFKLGLETPDGMDAETFKPILEQLTAKFGASESTQKITSLIAAILSGGKDIPKYLLNDRWIKAAIESGQISKAFIDYLIEREKEVQNQQQNNYQQSDNENNNDASNDYDGNNKKDKKKSNNSWWDEFDPSKR